VQGRAPDPPAQAPVSTGEIAGCSATVPYSETRQQVLARLPTVALGTQE
jgi:hypothetical protein